jgi:hypothetical protein
LQALLEAGTGKMDDWSAALTELGSEIDTMGAAARRMRDDIDKLQKALPATVGEAVSEVRALIDAFPAASVRAAIDSIPIERVRSQLLALFDDAENDIEKFKKNVELWFNNAMDRVGGWYKRKTQWVAFFLALGVATGMNVDTLAVIRYLQTHPTESAALVAEAQSFAKENPTAVQGAQGAEEQASSDPDQQTYTGVLTFGAPVAKDGVVQLKSDPAVVALAKSSIDVKEGAKDVKFAVKVPVSTTTIKATITATGAAQGTQTLVLPASLPAQYRAVQAELGKLGLPIGWVREPNKVEQEQRQEIPFMKQKPFVNWGTLFYHALGWFITALAATLGAPFWFDTLNRLISIRSAGKSPEEAPKAPKKVPVPREPGNIPAPATGTDHGAAT